MLPEQLLQGNELLLLAKSRYSALPPGNLFKFRFQNTNHFLDGFFFKVGTFNQVFDW